MLCLDVWMCSSRPDPTIVTWIEESFNKEVVHVDVIGSSSWSSQYCYITRDAAYKKTNYFVKTAPASEVEMFRSEALGLKALHETAMVVVPSVKHVGLTPDKRLSFMVADYLKFEAGLPASELGRSIALMHLAEPYDAKAKKGYFGFPVDNTLGGTSQPNGWMDNWVDFFRERRLQHQLRIARDPKLTELGDELCTHLELFYEGLDIKPCTLHGDLWAGNYAAVDEKAAIFDPATYYGHHEAEFGMSWCASGFWKAYHDVIPKAPGFEERQLIYRLYHYLNHYNLFGAGYYNQCVSILTTLTKDILRD